MKSPKDISINDFVYSLPEERIAQFPVAKRDESKLLIAQQNSLQEDAFYKLADYLPKDSLIIFNDTKVIRARMRFRKSTGAKIEVFILEPVLPTAEVQNAFQVQQECTWKCFVGNAKKWKQGSLELIFDAAGREVVLTATKGEAQGNAHLVHFSWSPPDLTFSDILMGSGSIPLPPYMNRDTEAADVERYQTIYAKHQGSVAAPTAGLHFTDKVMKSLQTKNIQSDYVSLHVGAGTFKPVSADNMGEHEMHSEQVLINKDTIVRLMKKNFHSLIVVGTTSTRTLESLYWYGVKLLKNPDAAFRIEQWEPYASAEHQNISTEKALSAVLDYMDRNQLQILQGETQIIIAPSYQFKLVDVLITNFHQPKSTLLLLVAAFYGDDWRKAYTYALEHDFRFLSYGDSCLFFKQ
jgi:S-adenosylmethionine:tRNA ribosyltransferase-isomerase